MTTQQQFITERRYLKSVTPATVTWYEQAFKRFEGALDSRAAAIERIGVLKERGLSVVSINVHLRVLNTFWHWRDGQGEKCSPQCTHIKIPKLKEEQTILEPISEERLRHLISFRPSGTNLRRAHLAALTILDCGLRASELLSLSHEQVDYDNMVFKVVGKGNKHRLVPFSSELRKNLFRYCVRGKQANSRLCFSTKNNTQVSVRNLERDFKVLGQRVGIPGLHPHQLRHTFALGYLRNGGDLFTLSRILGHSDIKTTAVYLRSMGIDQIKESHQKFSPLSAKR